LAKDDPHENNVYLCAQVNALIESIYVEKNSFSEVRRHGDFGQDTTEHLDGEMIILDGRIYRVLSDGRVDRVCDDVLTPFSCVIF